MKLTLRFFLTHGGVALLSILTGYGLLWEGSRILYLRQTREAQRKELMDFTLAAKESMLQREDVAVLNLMRAMVREPAVSFVVYSNPGIGAKVVLPALYQREEFRADRTVPDRRFLKDGTEVVEWSAPVPAGKGEPGRVWIGYSLAALDKDLRDQTSRGLLLGAIAGGGALGLGLLFSVLLARQLAAPLRKIRDGTHLVREGKLSALVEVDRRDEIGDLARDFNVMTTQLKELDEMKRDFTAGVTHDLGTPLHAIRSAINFLQGGEAGPLTEKQAEYLLLVSNSAAHLTDFINNLLTTARIEAAKVDPFPEPVDVFAHVKEIVDLYQPQAREKGLRLSLVKRSHYISLSADVTMFRQIVLNLVSNAIKFTPSGEVEVVLSEEDGDFVLEVRDTGVGIDPAFHERIFEKFFRVHQPKGSPARQGSGLGLTIVKGLCEAHGGRVAVESVLGQGSRFRVVLPKQPRRY
ncbi:MAG TPA: HAMP domain-containing sensor histidine kinase [bacterium]|nr:HAMP domain-containing sensor histidine kinase [bacterium]